MKTFPLLFILLALPLAACEQEVVYKGSSLDRELAGWNKEGWAVAGTNQPRKPGATADPDVHVIREADFSHVQFNTNFQVDDPRFPDLMRRQNGNPGGPATQPAGTQPATPQPGMNPFGAIPVTPEH